MTPQLKFLRRVRIHGRECGAVARALRHKVKSSSLYQADLEKSSGSTNERKQMATKTTFKRIALATVAALGFGLLSSSPSYSANTVATAFTKTISQNTTYLTVVSNGSTDDAGLIALTVANESVAANATTAVGLVRDSETMTVTVSAPPSASDSVGQVSIRPVKVSSAAVSGTTTLRVQVPIANDDSFTAAGSVSGYQLGGTDLISRYESPDLTPATGQTASGKAARYYFAIAANSTAAVDKGYFTVRVRTQTADSRIIDNTFFVRFVSSIADAGAVITVAGTGILRTGETLTYQTNKNYRATLADPNGGRIQMGIDVNATGVDSKSVSDLVPAMTARFVTSANVLIPGTTLDVADSGLAAIDHVAPTTASPSTASLEDTKANAAARAEADGVYGITSATSGFNGLTQAFTDLATNKLQVRLTGSSAEGTLAITTAPANASSLTAASTKLTVAGVAAADTAYTSTTAASPSATKAYSLPLSAKSVTLSIDTTQASQNLTTTTTWSGNYASANVTPAVSATGAVLTTATDADGTITRVITNSTPLAGAVATVVITGFANADHSVTVTLTWAAAVVSSVTVVEPVSGIHVALKGTTNFVVSVKDQFGNGMADQVLQPVVGGSAAALGNYSATTTYPTITTDASGLATWSFKDAAASNDGTDSITFRSISAASVVSDAYTITYKTTVAAAGSFLQFYNSNWGDGAIQATINTVIPTTGITGVGAKLALINGLNLSDGSLIAYNDHATDDAAVAIRTRVLTAAGLPATGASVTVTAGTGGHIVGAAGTPVSSRTFAVPTSGDISYQVLATAPGSIGFTVTSGTVTGSFTLEVANPSGTAARTIAISGASTGTANGEGIPMTVTVKDRYGNPVSSVLLTVAASGVGSFSGGATTQSFTTDATGTYTFLATSLVSAGGTGTFSASIATAGTDATSIAGYVGTTEVDSTLAAGVSTASAPVTFAAGTNAAQAAAEAATDAAAEAIDAANAATDAANLAAEAADAATVAAEEARDAADAATAAVEELATQVATLMAALKAQITTLANTVAKIAKKVKA